MALPPLRYVEMTVSAVFEHALVSTPTGDAGPFVFDPMSPPGVATYRTRTGHSFVQIERTQARLQTQYSGVFTDAASVQQRADYAREKVSALLDLLSRINATVSLVGAVLSARLMPDEPEREALRVNAARAFGVSPLLTGGEPAWDFVVRASRAYEADLFSNLYVQWFQVREIALHVGNEELAQGVLVREWEGNVTAEGLQLTLDRNNKRGLYAGKRSWSDAEFVAMACGAIEDAPSAFAPLLDALRGGHHV